MIPCRTLQLPWRSGTAKRHSTVITSRYGGCSMLTGRRRDSRAWAPCSSRQYSYFTGGIVAQAVRRSPPTDGVPSSRLGPSMWVSWWTKRGLGRIFTGFLPFSPTTNFIPPFLHTHLIHFVSFHPPL